MIFCRFIVKLGEKSYFKKSRLTRFQSCYHDCAIFALSSIYTRVFAMIFSIRHVFCPWKRKKCAKFALYTFSGSRLTLQSAKYNDKMQNAKHKMQNAKSKARNAKCKMQNAKWRIHFSGKSIFWQIHFLANTFFGEVSILRHAFTSTRFYFETSLLRLLLSK